jgi:hypothetical protein
MYRLACSFFAADSLKLYIMIIFTKDFFKTTQKKGEIMLEYLKGGGKF